MEIAAGGVQATGRRLLRGRLSAYLELLHLPPIAMVLLVTAGSMAAATQGWPPLGRLAPLLLALLLTQVAISFHNDYCDQALDAQAKPWRAIPSGLVSAKTVLRTSGGLVGVGLLVAAVLGWWVVCLIAVGASAGFTYNAWLKRTGWTWVAFWVALPTLPLAAFAAIGRLEPQLFTVYVIGAPLVMGVYVADTLADVESDTALGVRGLAHRLGPRWVRVAGWGGITLAQVLALWIRPYGGAPGSLFAASVALLAIAVVSDRFLHGRGHWLAMMGAAIFLTVDWLAAAGS